MAKNFRIFQTMVLFTFCLFIGIMVMVFVIAKSKKRGVTYTDPVDLQKCRYEEQVSNRENRHQSVSWQHIENIDE